MHKNFPVIISVVIVTASLGLGYVFWRQHAPDTAYTTEAITDIGEIILPTPSPTPEPVETPVSMTTPAPEPTPPPPLDDSDDHVKKSIGTLSGAQEIMALLTDEEILRKTVRAVHGLSEGRVVKEFRPVASPEGIFLVRPTNQRNPDNQALYRISRENYARYSRYISVFSLVNNDALVSLYKFYLPALEAAYDELGLPEGDFHGTLLKAIDVMLDAPEVNEALVLTRSVMFKYEDPNIEKLPSVHKLMLRMGGANQEALKLELKSFRERLVNLK